MLRPAMQRLQALRQGAPSVAPTGYAPPGYVDSNMGMPVNQFAPPQVGLGSMLMGAPVTQPTAGAAGGLGTQNRLAMLKNMIMKRIADRMQSPEMQAQLPQHAGRNPGYLANMILGRPVAQVMAGQIRPQGMTAGVVQSAPPPSSSIAPAFTPPPPQPAPTPTTSGAANSGSSAPAPSITSNITQTGEGGQTIQNTGSVAWASQGEKWR